MYDIDSSSWINCGDNFLSMDDNAVLWLYRVRVQHHVAQILY
jgi:hypothetical protein